jgi:hypothetical protein
MAMQVPDKLLGLRPWTSPKNEYVIEYAVSASAGEIGNGNIVAFSSGVLIPGVDTTDAHGIAGVALGHADATTAGQRLSVCIDPDQIYSALITVFSGSNVTAIIGQYAKLADTDATVVNNQSVCYVDGSTVAAAPTDADFHVQIIGPDPSVDQSNAIAGETRVLVKLTNPLFNGTDAVA